MFGRRPSPPPPPTPDPSDLLPPASSAAIFACIAIGLLTLLYLQKRVAEGRWLPPPGEKREYEAWVLRYSVIWMGSFAVIIAGQLYEQFTATSYFLVCGGLALPLALQPFLAPTGKARKPLSASHAVRAQLWIAIFGFIGNYWCARCPLSVLCATDHGAGCCAAACRYTHYFYCVLRAKYTMPSWRLNDVPIAMYLATHFYFSSYHVLANLPQRYVRTAYTAGPQRTALQVSSSGSTAV